MGWVFAAIVALGFVMTALTVAELSDVLRAKRVGYRVIAVFVLSTCTLAIVSGLVLLAAQILP